MNYLQGWAAWWSGKQTRQLDFVDGETDDAGLGSILGSALQEGLLQNNDVDAVIRRADRVVDGSGETFIAFSALQAGGKAVLKISYGPKRKMATGAEVQVLQGPDFETYVYEKVTNLLLENARTPHLFEMLGKMDCNVQMASLKASMPTSNTATLLHGALTRLRERCDAVNGDYDWDRLQILALKRNELKGAALSFTDTSSWKPVHWQSVIFQVLWTLQAFNGVGLRHNDLHDGNIWIEKMERPVNHVYFSKDWSTYWVVPIFHMVRIFDFDRATLSQSPVLNGDMMDNSELCRQLGMCNGTVNDRFDALTFLSELHSRNIRLHRVNQDPPIPIREWIESQISRDVLRRRVDHVVWPTDTQVPPVPEMYRSVGSADFTYNIWTDGYDPEYLQSKIPGRAFTEIGVYASEPTLRDLKQRAHFPDPESWLFNSTARRGHWR